MSLALTLTLCYLAGVVLTGGIYYAVKRSDDRAYGTGESRWITLRDAVGVSLFWPFYVFALALSVV